MQRSGVPDSPEDVEEHFEFIAHALRQFYR
jgi:hypothetical protein